MSRLSRLKLSARLCTLGLNPVAARPLARLILRFSRPYVQTLQTQTFGATLQFGSKTDAARPVARFMSRLSRPYDKTFKIQTLGATMPFGSNSGSGTTLGATHDQTFQTFCPNLPDSNSRRDSAIWNHV